MNFFTKIKSVVTDVHKLLIFALALIAIGLSLSKPLISLGVIIMSCAWLMNGSLKSRLKSFYNNKIALLLGSIYLISIIALINTNDFDYGFNDVRRKMFLFLLPFLLAGLSPLTKKELFLILKIYIIGVLGATLWSLYVYAGGLNIEIINVRDYSRFNSHIRFGLEVALAIFLSLFFLFKSSTNSKKVSWLIVTTWLILSLYLFKLFSGGVVLFASGFVLIVVFGLTTKSKKLKALLIICLSSLFVLVGFFVKNSITDFYKNDVVPIEKISHTKEGNKYRVDKKTKTSRLKENGYFVEKHIADKEFAEAWNAVSNINYEGKDLKGNDIKFTLRRFVTSKGMRKDKQTVDALTPEEIKAIESGVPNEKYLSMNYFSKRMHKILWEYDSYINGRSISGHSVLMRWEYWKTAINIIKKNPIFGVGTGDVQNAFISQYKTDKSTLDNKYRLRAHNQYLTYGVTFGLIGFGWFFVCLFYPIIKTKLYKNYIYLAFFAIVTLSMLTEDTLETQVGINFFVFFNTLFLFNLKQGKKQNEV